MKKYFVILTLIVVAACSCRKEDVQDPRNEKTIDYDELTTRSINSFLDFAKTPRPCLSLDKARAYLQNWCQSNGFLFNRDDYGNVWFDVPASSGCESFPKIILQCHMDMICACEPGLNPDYNTEVGIPLWEGTLLKGSRINLGSDDGIGVGIALTIATSNVPHGPLRILVTADEDCGMLGAMNLPAEVLDSRYLINLDQEEIGIINNGCGGGVRIGYAGDFNRVSAGDGETKIEINIDGLKGGHSGEDIGKGRLSAATVLNSLVDSLVLPYSGKIISIKCGTALGAIATNCSLSFSVESGYVETIKSTFAALIDEYKEEFPHETITHSLFDKSVGNDDYLMEVAGSTTLSNLFDAIPMGAFEYSEELADHVSKSNNIGIVEVNEGHLDFQIFARSDYNEWLAEMKVYYQEVAAQYSLDFEVQSESPAWFPKEDNPLEDFTLVYYDQYVPGAFAQPCMGTLEPAFFYQKKPDLQMISIGPDLTEVHTINEALHTETLKPLLQTLVQVLMNADKIEK